MFLCFPANPALGRDDSAISESDSARQAVVEVEDGLGRALEAGEIDPAEYALERALSLSHLNQVRNRYPGTRRPDDASLIFRELVRHFHSLDVDEQALARSLAERPQTTESMCSSAIAVCIHWVETAPHAPPLTDADGSGVPDWVETTEDVFVEVWQKEITEYGYRPPKSDMTSPNHGPDGSLDVYLQDTIPNGLFGQVFTDDPEAFSGQTAHWDFSTFILLDNDFSATQNADRNGLTGLQVTVAHEFFHSVQAAYDFVEDLWMTEGTAVWIVDEIYDSLNNPLYYLGVGGSPLENPWLPIDYGQEGAEYGSWVFWRFLSEYFGPGAAADPSVIRRVWEHADGSLGAEDMHSTAAVEATALERGTAFGTLFADFGVWNFVPPSFYEEGATYPTPSTERDFVFKGRAGRFRATSEIDHLSTNYYRFTIKGFKGRLIAKVDLPGLETGPRATVLVRDPSGAIRPFPVGLDAAGIGKVTVGVRKKMQVILVLTNASTRFECWQGSTFSCRGEPLDDELLYKFKISFA